MLKRILFFTLTFLFSNFCFANAITSQLFKDPTTPTAGNPNGQVTVAVFFDYQCSHCIAMSSRISAVIATNRHARFVFKEYPIFGQSSLLAAKAALAAYKQGRYDTFHHRLMTIHHPITQEKIINIARSMDLNINKFQSDINSRWVSQQIKQNEELANRLNVAGTPVFYIGKTNADDMSQVKYIFGEMSTYSLNKAIREAM